MRVTPKQQKFNLLKNNTKILMRLLQSYNLEYDLCSTLGADPKAFIPLLYSIDTLIKEIEEMPC